MSVGATLTITGRRHALAARPIFTSLGVGTGPPLLSLMVSLGDAAPLLTQVDGGIVSEGQPEVKYGLRTYLAT